MADSGEILWGTSSWTYTGWEGLVYQDLSRYGESFKGECLAEYARSPLFGCVGIDSAYYRPPTIHQIQSYARQLPPGFVCIIKVWRELTTPVFTEHFGPRGSEGKLNPGFLNPRLFRERFLPVFKAYFREHVGAFVLQFPFIPVEHVGEGGLVPLLDYFFGELGTQWPLAVEIRNPEWLEPSYFSMLKAHGVAHVFQVWTKMPLPHQVLERFPQSLDCANFGVCRALVRPGMPYRDAVAAYQPYSRVQHVDTRVRESVLTLARAALERDVKMMVAVNNRLEGCAPLTIEALQRELEGSGGPP